MTAVDIATQNQQTVQCEVMKVSGLFRSQHLRFLVHRFKSLVLCSNSNIETGRLSDTNTHNVTTK